MLPSMPVTQPVSPFNPDNAPYGVLTDSETNEDIRAATAEELEEGRAASPEGHTKTEGRRCYVVPWGPLALLCPPPAKAFRISNRTSGTDLGVWPAATESDAFEAMCSQAGVTANDDRDFDIKEVASPAPLKVGDLVIYEAPLRRRLLRGLRSVLTRVKDTATHVSDDALSYRLELLEPHNGNYDHDVWCSADELTKVEDTNGPLKVDYIALGGVERPIW